MWLILLSCNPKDPLPTNTWSQGCAQLTPDSQGYRLSGMCCAYLTLPQLELNKNRQFSVKANLFTFTGAGFASVPITVNGELSSDESTLTISYSTNSMTTTYQLRPGIAKIACDCGCL